MKNVEEEQRANYVIIVAGGRGTRMGTSIAKQFLPLAGIPILMRTIYAFAGSASHFNIIVVLPQGDISYWESLCKSHQFDVPHSVVAGGDTRFHSVLNGLSVIKDYTGVVLVHDGVRPLVSETLISRVVEGAVLFGTAIPCVAPVDSMRMLCGDQNRYVDRSQYRMVQTPQGFSTSTLIEAYSVGYSPHFTDDASVVEGTGMRMHLVEGETFNIKITTPADIVIGESLVKRKNIFAL